jgi:hypothetical protein
MFVLVAQIFQMQTWQGYRANIDDKGGENWATS